ncbi:MAG: cobalamin-dependent protein [Rhodobacteraceae bacterium]|nr:cobalamin-dependent protein [Paracoccaceae bacterium]
MPESLAAQALSMVALRAAEGREAPVTPWVGRLVEAAMDGAPAPMAALVEQMRMARVPSDTIVDLLIPAAMREVGGLWSEDRAGFAQVSVASARLQSLMRDLTRAHMTMPYASVGALPQAVLVVVPDGEQHTVGAMAVASLLGRAGFEPVLSLGEPRARLRARLQSERFAAVCLSLSRRETLETAGNLVKTIRRWCGDPVKVMIGGAALAAAGHVGVDTGADAITNDLPWALRQCGLTISMQGDGRSAISV